MKTLIAKFLLLNNYLDIPTDDLKLQLISHPDYPSIKSITDTLDYFKIDNIAVNVPKDKLTDLPSTFLALLNENNNHEIVLVKKNGDNILLYFDGGKKLKVGTQAFVEMWTGTIVAVEGSLNATKKSIKKIALLIPLIVIGLIAVQLMNFEAVSFLLALSSVLGVGLSYLIVKEEMGIHSKFVAKVCGAISNTNSCSTVINSTEGKLFNTFSLSDLCVTFFVATTLIYTTLGFNYAFAELILGPGMPVILYSLYQQAFVMKQWCSLCLGIIGLIALQAAIVFSTAPAFEMSWLYTMQASVLFLGVFIGWNYTKPLWKDALEGRKSKIEYLRFKRNHSLFNTLLQQNPIPHPDTLKDVSFIQLGAKEPVVTLTAILSPLCGFCVEAFEVYNKVIQFHGDKVRVNIMFNVPYQKKDNHGVQIATRVLEMNNVEGSAVANEGLKQWFVNRNIEKWQNDYGFSGFDPQVEHQLKAYSNWCTLNEVLYTPCSILDGRIFPQEYKITDLPLLVGDRIMFLLEKEKSMSVDL